MSESRERFDDLWREHAGAVLRYARRRVAADDVDDVVAETFVVAWRRIEEVPDLALPWLLGVARHVGANTRRSHTRRDALRGRITDHLLTGARHPDHRDGVTTPVAAALQRLSEADRELLTLIAWDGLSPAEAALALGCTRPALAVRLHRARRRLAALLEPAVVAAPTRAARPAQTRPAQTRPAQTRPARSATDTTGGSW